MMNQIKSRILRQQELSKAQTTEFPLKQPRNLSEAPSAHDLDYSTAPQNLYSKPARMGVVPEDIKVKPSIKKILANIQQEVEQQITEQSSNDMKGPLSLDMQRVRQSLVIGSGQGTKREGLKLIARPKFQLDQHDQQQQLPVDNKTPSRIVLKKSKVVFKEKAPLEQQFQTTKPAEQQIKRPGSAGKLRSVSYHVEQIKNIRNKRAGQVDSNTNSSNPGTGSGGSGEQQSSSGSGENTSFAQLSSIVKPQQTNEDLKKLDKALFTQKPLLERQDIKGTSAAFFPNKRQQQSMLMYNELFVVPKQKELEKLKKKGEEEFRAEDFISNRQQVVQRAREETQLQEGGLELKKGKMIQFDDGGERFMQELRIERTSPRGVKEHKDDEVDIMQVIMNKYNSSAAQKKNDKKQQKQGQSIFSQQIQVESPDNLYFTQIVTPLAPAQGWAPSIPAGSKNLNKCSVQDIALRAKSGLSAGDVQKEAHTAFNLAKLNDEEGNYKAAVSFYKRFFFCAKVLEDPIGAAMALNRIGVVYFKKRKISKSLKFHMKHSKITDTDNAFISYYNIGICLRIQGDFQKAYWYFSKAIEWAQFKEDPESQCLCHGQLGIALFLGKSQISNKSSGTVDPVVSFQRCMELSNSSKNHMRLQLDCLLCLGFLSFDKQEWRQAKDYFDQAFFKSKQMNENQIAEVCLCNSGIASGNMMLNQQKTMIDQELIENNLESVCSVLGHSMQKWLNQRVACRNEVLF